MSKEIDELWGVLNAIRVARKQSRNPHLFYEDIGILLPRMDEVLANAQKQQADNGQAVEALRDVMGWYASSDIAAVMSKRGEQAEYHRTLKAARVAIRKARTC